MPLDDPHRRADFVCEPGDQGRHRDALLRGARPFTRFAKLAVLIRDLVHSSQSELAFGLAAATGLAEHIYGLRGSSVVMVAKIGIALIALVIGSMGVRRIRRFRGRSVESERA